MLVDVEVGFDVFDEFDGRPRALQVDMVVVVVMAPVAVLVALGRPFLFLLDADRGVPLEEGVGYY